MSSFAMYIKGVRQGRGVSNSLFHTFFNYTVEIIEIEGLKFRVMRGLNIFITKIAQIVDIEGASCPGGRSIKYFYK